MAGQLPKPAELPHYQYTEPTIEVDGLVLDCSALNAYIRRAESAYNKANVTYCIGQDCPGKGKSDPDKEPDSNVELILDCSGYAYWTTYRRGIWAHSAGTQPDGKVYWFKISQPIPGATVRYSAAPGKKYGHSGVIIAPGPSGNFQTLDSTNEGPPKSSVGSIVYRPDGKKKWLAPNRSNPEFLVSSQAVLSVNGQPYKSPINVLLTAAKHPIATTVVVLVGGLAMLGGTIALIEYMRAKQKKA